MVERMMLQYKVWRKMYLFHYLSQILILGMSYYGWTNDVTIQGMKKNGSFPLPDIWISILKN